jgi:flagellar hook-length control protein FliK
MADPATLSLESMVADTVSYWVAQGVQNAELKLDGFGGQPVEVSITLKGDEAHIGFRTDQPEIRQILEGAVAHLKDLLTSEGLVLSGVSVGTSGQDGTGAQEQRNRPGTRQATITTTETAPTESRQRANPAVGRAVDLFV